MKSSYRFLGILCAVAVIGLFASQQSAYAATITWDGSVDGNWSTAANWDTNAVPVNGDDLVFPTGAGNAVMTNDLNSLVNVDSMTFNANYGVTAPSGSAPLTISSSAGITLGSGTRVDVGGNFALSLGTDININMSNSSTLDFGGKISGNFGMVVNGGFMYLTNANTFDGNVVLNNATVAVANNTGLGTAVGNTTVYSGSQLMFWRGITVPENIILNNNNSSLAMPVLRLSNSDQNTVSGSITVMGEVTIRSNEDLQNFVLNGQIIGDSSARVNFTVGNILLNSATNTFSGTYNLSEQTVLSLGGVNASANVVLNNGSLLTGIGTVNSITMNDTSIIKPGLGCTGDIYVNGNVVSTGNTTYNFCYSLSLNHPILWVNGTINLNNSTLVIETLDNSASSSFLITRGMSGISGQFAGLPDQAYLYTSGYVRRVQIRYETGSVGENLVWINSAKDLPTVSVVDNNDPSTYGQNVTFTATVTPHILGTPTGNVRFVDGPTLLGTVPMVNGVATLTINSLYVGTHGIWAEYTGDSNFDSNVSPTIAHTVNQTTPTIALVSSINPALTTDTLSFTVTVTGTGTSSTPTGTVAIFHGPTQLGSGTLNSSGVVVITSRISLPAGVHLITAEYCGDDNYAFVASENYSQLVVEPLANTGENMNMFGLAILNIMSITGTAAFVVRRKFVL